MFIPKYFKVTDVEEIRDFIQHHSFGTVVTTKNEKPIATHLPLQLIQDRNDYYITGHVAYGNPQWKTFENFEEGLVMFQGPHAYVSSSWYEKENVPTWNYQAVHVYGKASLLNAEELKQDLKSLLEKYEGRRDNPVLWDTLSPALLEREIKGIVGFKIKIEEIQAAYKLSQNRTEKDYHQIVHKLYEERNLNAHQVAEVMDRQSNKNKKTRH